MPFHALRGLPFDTFAGRTEDVGWRLGLGGYQPHLRSPTSGKMANTMNGRGLIAARMRPVL